jgi:hypothetical protein
MGMRFAWFTVGSRAVCERVIAMSKINESYRAAFRIDAAFERHARYRWGQLLALGGLQSSLALVPAILHGFRFVVIANEYSANFPTRVFRGMEINHQYGKSYELEAKLLEWSTADWSTASHASACCDPSTKYDSVPSSAALSSTWMPSLAATRDLRRTVVQGLSEVCVRVPRPLPVPGRLSTTARVR